MSKIRMGADKIIEFEKPYNVKWNHLVSRYFLILGSAALLYYEPLFLIVVRALIIKCLLYMALIT